MELIISYPLWGLHNLVYDNMNHAMVNGYIMSSMFATLQILSQRLNLKRAIATAVLSLKDLHSWSKESTFVHTICLFSLSADMLLKFHISVQICFFISKAH